MFFAEFRRLETKEKRMKNINGQNLLIIIDLVYNYEKYVYKQAYIVFIYNPTMSHALHTFKVGLRKNRLHIK